MRLRVDALASRALALALIFFGGVFVVSGVRRYREASQGAGWVTVPGQILHSGVTARSDPKATGDSAYAPLVLYTYSVGGAIYDGSRITFTGYPAGDRAAAGKVAARYRTGTPVTVHYDPEHPGNAVLDLRVPWSIPLLIAAGLIPLALGVALLRAQLPPRSVRRRVSHA